jgi:hypothetical protein
MPPEMKLLFLNYPPHLPQYSALDTAKTELLKYISSNIHYLKQPETRGRDSSHKGGKKQK